MMQLRILFMILGITVLVMLTTGCGGFMITAGGSASSGGGGGAGGGQPATAPATGGGAPMASVQGGDTITFVNNSVWDIKQLYIAPAGSNSWGNNLLGNVIVSYKLKVAISGLKCGTVDIRVVGADNESGVIRGANLCAQGKTYSITDVGLVRYSRYFK